MSTVVIRQVLDQEQEKYDAAVHHPLQSWAWGEFKKKTGVDVVRLAAFEGQRLLAGYQVTLHKAPLLGWNLGYFARAGSPDDAQTFALKTIADKYNLIFIKSEPNTYAPTATAKPTLEPIHNYLKDHSYRPGRPMFTPYSFILDINKSEPELFSGLKSKTRYNIKVAQKHGVQVTVDDSDTAFEDYITLWQQTTSRQGFYAHDQAYQRHMWAVMKAAGIAHLVRATYQDKPLGIWIIFIYKNILFYPYGASSRDHREVMANNLLAWNTILFGKSQGCTTFDMWGSLGPEPDPKDPWYGFHRFKEGYGGTLMEFVGSWDYVRDPQKYQVFRLLDNWRWKYLHLRSKLPF